MNEGFCGECKHLELFDDYFGTGVCMLNDQRAIVTEDDTCDEFEDMDDA